MSSERNLQKILKCKKEKRCSRSQPSVFYSHDIEQNNKTQKKLDTFDKSYPSSCRFRATSSILPPLTNKRCHSKKHKSIKKLFMNHLKGRINRSVYNNIKLIDDSLYKRLLNVHPKKAEQTNFLQYNINMTNKAKTCIQKRKFCLSVALSNSFQKNLFSSMSKTKEIKFNYCIFPGNNSNLIEKCMQTRKLWNPIKKDLIHYAHFIWSPTSKSINFSKSSKSIQFVNHLEYHTELSNKMKLFENLMKYCEKNSINLFSFFPFTIVIQLSYLRFSEILNSFKIFYNEIDKYCHTNSIPVRYSELFRKDFNKVFGNRQIIQIPETHFINANLWLIKPVHLNRGRCIKVERDLDSIINEVVTIGQQKKLIDDKTEIQSKAENIILQKYIENPLLYRKKKFDIRIWVLFHYNGEVYVFKEGHLKASSEIFNINSKDPYVHLTNYSVQKYHSNFSQEDIGNEISFSDFQAELNKTSSINFFKDIYPKICNIIRITALSVKDKINFLNRKNCFEIFGYDFLIDANYNPFLIEINTNPGLDNSSPLCNMLTSRMIDDALRLTIDTYRNPDYNPFSYSCFPVDNYPDYENMWNKINLSKRAFSMKINKNQMT